MNCQDRVLPTWNRRGGCASKKKTRSLRSGADGVVIMVNVDVETLSGTDHPVCAFIRRLRSIFLMAQPPLLSGGGEHPSLQFIHTFIDRRYSSDSNVLPDISEPQRKTRDGNCRRRSSLEKDRVASR